VFWFYQANIDRRWWRGSARSGQGRWPASRPLSTATRAGCP